MKIALLQKNFHSNSIGLLSGLQARGHEVLNVVNYTAGTKSGSDSVDVRTVGIPYGAMSRRLLGSSKKRLDYHGMPRFGLLLRTLRSFRPDVVIIKEPRVSALVGGAMAQMLGARVVLMQDKPKRGRKHPFLVTLGRVLLPRVKFHTGHFGPIDADVRFGLMGCSRLLPYPVRPGPHPRARLRTIANNPEHQVRIVTVGSLNNRRKRNAMLLEAIESAGVRDRVAVTFIGLGDEQSRDFRAIRELESRLGWTASEIVLNLRHPEVMERLSGQDVFVLPSRNEPFSVAVPEAMSRGLPVICSDTNGSRVCFEDGISGFVFPTDSVETLGQCIRRFVDDRSLLHEMSIAAHDRVIDQLTPERWAERFELLVVEGHRR